MHRRPFKIFVITFALAFSCVMNHGKRSAAAAEPSVEKKNDGTIVITQSLSVASADAPTALNWNNAMDYCKKLEESGHDDWRVPTKWELDLLFQNREKGPLAGTFNLTGEDPGGWYWSSNDMFGSNVWGQRLSNGKQQDLSKYGTASVRCVRD
jgi:hypothetical protein